MGERKKNRNSIDRDTEMGICVAGQFISGTNENS